MKRKMVSTLLGIALLSAAVSGCGSGASETAGQTAAAQADTLSEDDVNEIFRIMHTLKGSAAMMEFEPLMTIAHRIEDLFYLIREKTMEVVPEQDRPQLFDLLFKSIDYFRNEVSKIENGEPLSNNIDNFLNTINMFIDKIASRNFSGDDTFSERCRSSR